MYSIAPKHSIMVIKFAVVSMFDNASKAKVVCP